MPKTIKDYLLKAQKENFAIGHFNFSTQAQLKSIIEAARNLAAPVIVGTSRGEASFAGMREAAALIKAYREDLFAETGREPALFLNLDHAKDIGKIKEAIAAGYDAVHFDGSLLSYKENADITKKVVVMAAKKGVLAEGEMGRIGTESSRIYEEKMVINEKDLTRPDEALRFVRETGVDSLAVGVGTFHGIEAKGRNPKIRLDRLKEIKEKLDSAGSPFLVLHGSSGTRIEDIKKAIKLGIVKINVNTDLRIAFTKALRESLRSKKEESTPYKYLPAAVEAMRIVIEEKIKLFGSAGKL